MNKKVSLYERLISYIAVRFPDHLNKKMSLNEILIAIFTLLSFISIILFPKGENKENEKKIDSILQEFQSTDSPGAAIMVIKDGRIIFQKGYGLATTTTKIDKETNFRVSLCLKTIYCHVHHDIKRERRIKL